MNYLLYLIELLYVQYTVKQFPYYNNNNISAYEIECVGIDSSELDIMRLICRSYYYIRYWEDLTRRISSFTYTLIKSWILGQ